MRKKELQVRNKLCLAKEGESLYVDPKSHGYNNFPVNLILSESWPSD